MIRFFEVRGLEGSDEPPEYFGFMDTGTDRVLEFDGAQLFCDRADFREHCDHFSSRSIERYERLIPARIK